MALDPRISLAARAPDVSQAIGIFENAMMNNQTRGLRQAQEERASALVPFQQQLQQQNIDINQQGLEQSRQQQRLSRVNETAQRLKPYIDANDNKGAQEFILNNISAIQGRIAKGSKEDVTESMETLAKLQANDMQGVANDINAISNIANNKGMSAGQRDFESKVNLVKGDPELTTPAAKAAAIDLGLEARASTSAQERIANDAELTNAVANSTAIIEGKKEGAKLTQQLKHKPAITKAVKLAEKAATERGDTFTDLARMEASLPGVREVVAELVDLSSIATSTLGGKAFDFAVKESGFGSTKGADARAKMVSIVDNQVLPLLKETFGAAFTVAEGDNLKASLVDPDASPSQKRAQLESFLAQKERNLRTKQNQLGGELSITDEFAGFKVIR